MKLPHSLPSFPETTVDVVIRVPKICWSKSSDHVSLDSVEWRRRRRRRRLLLLLSNPLGLLCLLHLLGLLLLLLLLPLDPDFEEDFEDDFDLLRVGRGVGCLVG